MHHWFQVLSIENEVYPRSEKVWELFALSLWQLLTILFVYVYFFFLQVAKCCSLYLFSVLMSHLALGGQTTAVLMMQSF
jgi:hypothetical protein